MSPETNTNAQRLSVISHLLLSACDMVAQDFLIFPAVSYWESRYPQRTRALVFFISFSAYSFEYLEYFRRKLTKDTSAHDARTHGGVTVVQIVAKMACDTPQAATTAQRRTASAADQKELLDLARKMGMTVLYAKDASIAGMKQENGGEGKCRAQRRWSCPESDASTKPRKTEASTSPQIAHSVVSCDACLEPNPVLQGNLAARRNIKLAPHLRSDGPANKAPFEQRLGGYGPAPQPRTNKASSEHRPLPLKMSLASQFFHIIIFLFALSKNFVLAPMQLFVALCSSQPPWCPTSPGSPKGRHIEQHHLRGLVHGKLYSPQWLAFEALEAFSTDPTNL